MTSLTDLKGFYFRALDKNMNPRELKVIVKVSRSPQKLEEMYNLGTISTQED